MLSPHLSVIVPAYNVEKYIEECISALVADSHVNEIYVIDDQSTDGTWDVVTTLAKAERKKIICVRVVAHKNQYAAKNLALYLIRHLPLTRYIAFCDADDVIYKDRFSQQLGMLEADPLLWAVGGGCRNTDEDGIPSETEMAWPLDSDPLIRGQRAFGIGLWNATATYRKEVFDYLGCFDSTPTMGDTEFFTRLVWASILTGNRIANITKPVVWRRIRSTQCSSNVGSDLSPYRQAYQKFLQSKFAFLRTMYQLGNLERSQLYREEAPNHLQHQLAALEH